MTQNLVVTGYGWLAGYVGKALAGDVNIIGTTRSHEKCLALKDQGIEGVEYTLGEDPEIVCRHLSNATLLLNVPPGRKSTHLETFTANMTALIDAVVSAGVRHIVFVSTTSVYGDSNNELINETSATAPQTESAKAHVAIENYLLAKRDQIDVSILRLAGLVGPDRHPARSLSGRELDAGNKRVNLVHIHDVAEAFKKIIGSAPINGILHLCSLSHPKRGVYYVDAAKALNIEPPYFADTENSPSGKVIDAHKSWEQLGVSPQYSDPYSMF